MPKKKPEPVTITGPSGQTYTITINGDGLKIVISEQHRLVYTSVMTGTGYIEFQTEAVDRRR